MTRHANILPLAVLLTVTTITGCGPDKDASPTPNPSQSITVDPPPESLTHPEPNTPQASSNTRPDTNSDAGTPVKSDSPTPGKPYREPDLKAELTPPPSNWKSLGLVKQEHGYDRSWFSPSGKIKIGVFRSPLPPIAPTGMILNGYIDNMKKAEGGAKLESKVEESPGVIHFVCVSPKTRADVRFTHKGSDAWFVSIRTPPNDKPSDEEMKAATDFQNAVKVEN